MQLKDFVPPILIRVTRKIIALDSKVYSSYQEAALACSNYGYEQGAVVNVVFEKTKRYRELLRAQKPLEIDLSNVRAPLGLTLALGDVVKEIRVIDFGGACGAHYLVAKALFGERIKLRWYVVETSAMARKAKALENNELKFFDDLSIARTEIGEPDLVFSSGALQCVPDPYISLKDLTECSARYIFLTRWGLTTGNKDLVCVQESKLSWNGPGALPDGMTDGVTRYPMTAARKDRVEQILKEKYDIRMQFNEDKGAYRLDGHNIDMYGYFGEAS